LDVLFLEAFMWFVVKDCEFILSLHSWLFNGAGSSNLPKHSKEMLALAISL
jgi:hypothetical protein